MSTPVTPVPTVITLDASDNEGLTFAASTRLIEVAWGDGAASDSNVLWVDYGGADGAARGAQALPVRPGASGRQLIDVAGIGAIGISGSSAFDVHVRVIAL